MLRMPLSLALLIVSLSAVAAPLSLGPEMPLTAPAVEPAPFTRGNPQVASNGRDFLAVWWDQRSGNYAHGIRAARIDRDGTLLDVTGIDVAAVAGGQWATVASDGRDYLVAYNCALNAHESAACFARIEAQTGRITARNKIDRAWNPTLGSNGRNYLVTYDARDVRGPNDTDLNGAIVSRDATTIGQPFRLAGNHMPGAAIASNGEVYFAGWSLYRNLAGAIVSGDGAVTPTDTISTTVPAWGPAAFSWSVASDGEDFLVVWQQNVRLAGQQYETALRARKVSPTGARGPERTLLEPGAEKTWNVRASWNGSRYVIAYTGSTSPATAPYLWWDAATDVRAIASNADGDLAAPPSTLAERSGREVTGAAASNDLGTLVVWEHARRGNAIQIEARLVSPNGEPVSERIALSHSVTWQQSLAGSADTLAWEEFVGEEQRRKVFVQRIGAEGRGTAVESSTREQLHPAVGGAIAGWLQQDLNTSGHAEVVVKQLADLASPPLLLATAPRDSWMAIATTGTTHLVAWESESHQILGARFNADGSLIDSSAIEISSGPRPQSRPIIATDGSRFLVVWSMEEPLEACAGYCDPPLSLHAAVVTTSGFVTGPPIAIAPTYSRDAAVVWNGAEYAIFWERHHHVEARRIDRHGNLRDAAPRAVAFPGGVAGATWNGREYLIALSQPYPGLRSPFAVASVDRDLRLIETADVKSAYVPVTRVIFFPRENHTALMAFQAIGEDRVSRATGRLVGDDLNPPRRRAVSRR